MVNNYTNINKTNESVNSDCQQLHQYQQSKRKCRQLHQQQTITSNLKSIKVIKIPEHMTLEIQSLAWDTQKNMVVLNRLIRSQHSPLDNWTSNGNTFIKKDKTKSANICFHSKDHNVLM
jgi:hypothetical protein